MSGLPKAPSLPKVPRLPSAPHREPGLPKVAKAPKKSTWGDPDADGSEDPNIPRHLRKPVGTIVPFKQWRNNPDAADSLGYRMGFAYVRPTAGERGGLHPEDPNRVSIRSCGALQYGGVKYWVGVAELQYEVYIARMGSIVVFSSLPRERADGTPAAAAPDLWLLRPLGTAGFAPGTSAHKVSRHRDLVRGVEHYPELVDWCAAVTAGVERQLIPREVHPSHDGMVRRYAQLIQTYIRTAIADGAARGVPRVEAEYGHAIFSRHVGAQWRRLLYTATPNLQHALDVATVLALRPDPEALDLLRIAAACQYGMPGFPGDRLLLSLLDEYRGRAAQWNSGLLINHHLASWEAAGSLAECRLRDYSNWLSQHSATIRAKP